MFEKQIPISNICGMTSDHAQVMLGTKCSFQTKLKEKNPGVLIIGCVCHSAATSFKYSCEKIPDVDAVIKGLPSFLNASPKRTAIYRGIVEEIGDMFHKIPSHAETRWLVRHNCINVILKHWDNIFRILLVLVSEKVEKAADLVNKMQNSLTKAYFLFLKYTLAVFNVYNATFQKWETMVQELQPQSANILLWILNNYLKQGLLNPDLFFHVVRKINFSDSDNQIALEAINVGKEAQAYLDLDRGDVKPFASLWRGPIP